MEFYMKLPRNWKEKAMFMFIVSFISVNIIGPIISLWEMGWSMANYLKVLHVLPFIWIAVILVLAVESAPGYVRLAVSTWKISMPSIILKSARHVMPVSMPAPKWRYSSTFPGRKRILPPDTAMNI